MDDIEMLLDPIELDLIDRAAEDLEDAVGLEDNIDNEVIDVIAGDQMDEMIMSGECRLTDEELNGCDELDDPEFDNLEDM